MKYQPVIGLEIHCELLTNSKIFCSCKNLFGGKSNSRVCPICMGMPGALPSLNKKVVLLAVKAGIATHCTINKYSAFDRKNYFYPDLPKAYQITQFEYPICSDGYIELSNGKRIGINRIHIEEDAGKLTHEGDMSLADYNRCGVPLIEIVTEPDFRNVDDVIEFVRQITQRLKYADVCDGRMEQGSLRVDVNISLMPYDSDVFGERAELKNLNSLKSISSAINYEIRRQASLLDSDKQVRRETRRFDESNGTTKLLRSKEELQDYRYFPEPNIPPIKLTDTDISGIADTPPELPKEREERYINNYGLTPDDAMLITAQKSFSDFYDNAVAHFNDYHLISKLMLGEVSRCINNSNSDISEAKFKPHDIAKIAELLSNNIISNAAAKEIISVMFHQGGNPEEIARTNGFIMSNDDTAVSEAAELVFKENEKLVTQYKNGEEKLFGFIMGQVIRKCGKSANPALIRKILEHKLKETK